QKIKGREFNTAEDLDNYLEELLPADVYAKYHEKIAEAARVVHHYDLTPSAVEALEKGGKLPAALTPQLASVVGRPFQSRVDFEAALRGRARLSGDDFQKYAPVLADTAAVLLARDRVTGELKPMWARDPRSGQLLPQKGDDGEPTPKINEATGQQEDP